MHKSGTYASHYHMSSKRAGSQLGKKLTLFILHHIADGLDVLLQRDRTERQILRKLAEMQKRGFIKHTGQKYTLTFKGKRLLSEEKVWALTIPTPKHWDSKWRMVMYDIPARKAGQRNAFRARLKELGLVLYQNSVWVYPYPLQETVDKIADFYNISDCVLFAVAESLHKERTLKSKFKLQ
jgi:phenylacetic acid degradation operon negative regulatory protein